MIRQRAVLAKISLGVIIGLGLVLRLRGITWGLPHAPFLAHYHPDEIGNTLACISRMSLSPLRLNPGNFVNPSLFFYVGGFTLHFLSLLTSRIVSPFGGADFSVDQLHNLFLAGRALTLLIGVLTIYIVYEAGRKLYDRSVGLLGALFLAVVPVHVVHSHYFTVNVAGTLWVALVLLLAGKIWRSGGKGWYLLAGLAAGLATATKYLGLLLLVPVLTAHLLRSRASRPCKGGRVSLVVLLLVGAVLGFVLGCPYSVIAPGEFGADFYEMMRFNQFPPSLGRLFTNLYFSLSPLTLALALVSVVLLLLAGKPQDWIVLSFFLLFFAVSWSSASHFTRHILPMAPAAAIIIGRGAEIAWRHRRGAEWRSVVVCLCALAATYTALYSWKYVTVMAREDPRDECARWLNENLEPGSRIGLFSPPWFYTPPFDASRYPATLIHRNLAYLRRDDPACFIITSFEYKWLTHINSGAGIYIRKDFQQELASTRMFMERELPGAGYGRAAVFSRDVRPPGFGWFPARVPHDWEYPAPEIVLFLKKGDSPPFY